MKRSLIHQRYSPILAREDPRRCKLSYPLSCYPKTTDSRAYGLSEEGSLVPAVDRVDRRQVYARLRERLHDGSEPDERGGTRERKAEGTGAEKPRKRRRESGKASPRSYRERKRESRRI